MFPIVSWEKTTCRRNNTTAAEMSEKFTNFLASGRVTSTTNIPQGAMSMPIHGDRLRGQPEIVDISVGVNCFGTIELEPSSKPAWSENIHWIRAIKLSDDCHSYNVQLRLFTSTKQSTSSRSNFQTSLVLQCVRPIEAGQELLLWFSEEILAMLQIVFLTPANIQGEKKYICTRCPASYESPNPLKLHLTLSCQKYSVAWLWEKLSKIVTDNTSHQKISPKQEFNFKLVPNEDQKKAIDLSLGGQSQPKMFKAQSTESAFKPFQKMELTNINNNTAISEPSSRCFYQWPVIPYSEEYIPVPYDFTNQRPADDEAEIETLFSTLGKSKQGHICLYCGKCYSRKYGLKIHIRTHTGYKPLKCKYCLRPFGDPSNLNKHVRLHVTGDTPYKCDLCGKVLVRRRDLERHLRSRHMSEMLPESNSASYSISNEESVLTSEDEDTISVD